MFTVLSKSFDPKTQVAHEVSAYEVAGGCVVRSLTTVRETLSESLVFVPRSKIEIDRENDFTAYRLVTAEDPLEEATRKLRYAMIDAAADQASRRNACPIQGPDEVALAEEPAKAEEPQVVTPPEDPAPAEPAADATEPAKE